MKIKILPLICLLFLLSTTLITNQKPTIAYDVITSQTGEKYETGYIAFDSNIIENKIFKDISIGIVITISNTIVKNCQFINCNDEGIVVYSNNNLFDSCTFINCNDGIELQKSSNNIIKNCNFINCYHAGIDGIIQSNNNNQITSCNFKNNCYAIYFQNSKNNQIKNCVFKNNKKDLVEL